MVAPEKRIGSRWSGAGILTLPGHRAVPVIRKERQMGKLFMFLAIFAATGCAGMQACTVVVKPAVDRGTVVARHPGQ